jgi:glycosyltransferase involved in cell wall biosynthesis
MPMANNMFLSLIIPAYNDPDAVERLIVSIKKSKKAPSYEIIVVDDGSDKRLVVSKQHIEKIYSIHASKRYPLKTIRFFKNQGPAVARNRGVERAKGEFVVFLDCDVEVFPDTLYQIAKIYRDDPDIVALTGVWVKDQRSTKFFPNFKALRDWSYWIHERDKSGYYYLFSTRIASIKRSVFLRLGGFDETYPAPLVEDIELTYRIARRYAIIFAPHVRVRHEFEDFWPVAKKYFLRAYYWTKLYTNRKKFDPVATTLTEAVTTVSGVGVVGSAGLFVISYLSNLGSLSNLEEILGLVMIVATMIHLFLVRRFLLFVFSEKGLVFAVQSFFMGLVLYCVIFAGAVIGRLK